MNGGILHCVLWSSLTTCKHDSTMYNKFMCHHPQHAMNTVQWNTAQWIPLNSRHTWYNRKFWKCWIGNTPNNRQQSCTLAILQNPLNGQFSHTHWIAEPSEIWSQIYTCPWTCTNQFHCTCMSPSLSHGWWQIHNSSQNRSLPESRYPLSQCTCCVQSALDSCTAMFQHGHWMKHDTDFPYLIE